MKKETIAFIGAGNLASSLIAGLITNGYPADKIWASNPSQEKLSLLAKRYAIHTTSNNQEAAENAQVIILAVKPFLFPEVCSEISHIITCNYPLVISVAVGATIELIQKWLKIAPSTENSSSIKYTIIRAMPNIAATVGAGATGLFSHEHVLPTQKEIAEVIFRSVGITLWVENEEKLGPLCALSGSGPAYVFYFMEALEAAGVSMGLSQEEAKLLTEQTVLGAAKMALESGQSLHHLRRAVTSSKGTTEAAIDILEKMNFSSCIQQALAAALNRHTEITKTLIEKGE